MTNRKKLSAALACGLLGCLCMGTGDWLMLYGDPVYDGTLRWLTRGAAAIPAWWNGIAMALSFPAVILYGVALFAIAAYLSGEKQQKIYHSSVISLTSWQYWSVDKMKTDNKAFWQRFAKLYGPVMERSGAKLYRDICQHIRPYLNRDMNVLELACGIGLLSHPLSGQVRLWEGTDFSPAMIAEAKKKNLSARLHFSVQDATALTYALGSFDAVVIANALHIMPDPDKAMTEIRRVLKPEGLLFAPTFVHGEGTGFQGTGATDEAGGVPYIPRVGR